MALIKFCDHCKTTYPYEDSDCKNRCKEKRKAKRAKEYNKHSRKNTDIYNSRAWRSIREKIKSLDSICLWSYYIEKKVVKGKLVHHIIELEDDRTKAYDTTNLIFVSDEAHRIIHELYKKDKHKTQQILFNLIKNHRKD